MCVWELPFQLFFLSPSLHLLLIFYCGTKFVYIHICFARVLVCMWVNVWLYVWARLLLKFKIFVWMCVLFSYICMYVSLFLPLRFKSVYFVVAFCCILLHFFPLFIYLFFFFCCFVYRGVHLLGYKCVCLF